MPVNPVLAGNALTAGLEAIFTKNYEPKKRKTDARLGMVMNLTVPSDKLTEIYAYPTSPVHPKIWRRGEDIESKPFDYVPFNVKNDDWQAKIEWHENDREDDQTGSLEQQAQNAGINFSQHDERIMFQMLQDSADAELLQAVPNASDGAAWFATTAGGLDRFGVTDGNLLTGATVTSAQNVRLDFFKSIGQFRSFQDTEGQPFWDDATVDGKYVIIYSTLDEEVFREAFIASRTVKIITAGGDTAAVSNVILESGVEVTLWSSARIPSGDWYIFLNDIPQNMKGPFKQNRKGLRSISKTMENSDTAAQTKIEWIQWDSRSGYGINLPIQSIKINN